MWSGIAWAVAVFLLGVLAIWRIDRYARAALELSRQAQTTDEELKRQAQMLTDEQKKIELQERRTAASLAERNIGEQAELERVQLKLRTAEACTAAEVAEAPETIQVRIDEELTVIAARAEGRAAAAKDQALRLESPDTVLPIESLAEAYAAYIESGGQENFSTWLGSVIVTASGEVRKA